jgi:S1-C subfamily serine protease
MKLDDFPPIHEKYHRHVYAVGVVDAKTHKLQTPSDTSLGTAFAVSDEGHFLTAFHVIENEHYGIERGKRILALKGMHGYGVPNEPAFRAELVEVFRNSDIALLKSDQSRSGYIPTASALAKPGAWVATIGYPIPYFSEDLGKQMLDKRIVSAMISAAFVENGVRFVELDKHLSHGHSGGPIISLAGLAFALAISYRRGWSVVREKISENGKQVERNRVLELPVQFSRGSMLQNVVSRLRKHGVPIHRVASGLVEPANP